MLDVEGIEPTTFVLLSVYTDHLYILVYKHNALTY